MITREEVEKLGALHVVEPAMLSLYLTVPRPADLAARAGELIAAAEAACGQPMAEQDRTWVLERLPPCARDGPRRTVAVFAYADTGLLEVVPLPCPLPERGVLGVRPHIRPLLLARQRCPAYHVAVLDQRRTWLFWVDGDEVESVWMPTARHDHDTAAQLTELMRRAEPGPLVLGGDEDSSRRLLAAVPPMVREAIAGRFTADPRTLTAARVRDLASPVIARQSELRARSTAAAILAMPPGGRSAVGLPACLAAVSAGLVPTLVVPLDGLVAGYECGRCGALSLDADDCCPDWGTAALPVPDVIEEMVSRVLKDGGEVTVIADGSSPVAARLS
jgi:peptide chain release factor subunit 1